MRAQAGKEDELRRALEALIEPTTHDAGYLDYDLHVDVDDPRRFAFYENWENDELHADHMKTPHIDAFVAVMDDLLEGPLQVERYHRIA